MSDLVNKVASRIFAARRNAEALLKPADTRESKLKLEQQRAREALSAKTERLRALRLAKEAADKEAAGPARVRKPRVSRQRPRSK
jgi:hypothetical protein